MRHLHRATASNPACLANYRHGQQNWDDMTAGDKAQIRMCLEEMQGRRCAYCEGPLDSLGEHIEHFRRKHHFPMLTFEWSNLFLSCNQYDSCGHYKDHGAGPYNVGELIEPCVDNPDKFLRFRTDGTVNARYGLAAAELHRAEETLRVFNLHANWGRLRNMRKAAVSSYVSLAANCEEFSIEDLQDFFREELTTIAGLPFYTAIRHVLTEP